MISNNGFIGVTCVGVGPGDPSLLTLAAIKAIEEASLVAYPVAKKGVNGIAFKIASQWINKDQKLLPLLFPMVPDLQPREESWQSAADQIFCAVSNGQSVVFLSQGDVSLFSTTSYLLLALKAKYPNCPVRIIPGVTAFAAAAAKGKWPLCLHDDQLLIVPTPNTISEFETLLHDARHLRRVLALLKLGHRWPWIREVLKDKGLLKETLFAEKLGWSDQEVKPAIEVTSEPKSYFSLLLIRQSWPEDIPK